MCVKHLVIVTQLKQTLNLKKENSYYQAPANLQQILLDFKIF